MFPLNIHFLKYLNNKDDGVRAGICNKCISFSYIYEIYFMKNLYLGLKAKHLCYLLHAKKNAIEGVIIRIYFM